MNPEYDEDSRRFRHPDAPLEEFGGDTMAEPEQKPEKPSKRRRLPKPPRRGRRILIRFIRFLIFISLIAVAAYGFYLFNIISKVSTNALQLGPLSADASGRTNILVLGKGDPGHDGENLTDTMMILSLDGPGHRMAQISIPRDLRVNIPGYGYGKVNSANAYGGVELAEKTVTNTFDIPIDYYVETNFSGLKEVVDAVGGLDVDVKERLTDSEYPCDDNQYEVCGLDIKPALQHMDGATVLKYVRCRKGTCGNDFGRAARQQEVIGLLRPKITDWHVVLNPIKLKSLVTAIQKGVQTDMGMIQLLLLGNAVNQAGDNNPVHLVLSNGPDGYLRSDPNGSSDLLPIGGNFDDISEKIKSIFSSN